jgi:hypothetical protein
MISGSMAMTLSLILSIRIDKIQHIKSYITGDKANNIDSVCKLIESKLSYFFDAEATASCTNKLVDFIDKLYYTEAAHAIENIKKRQSIEAKKARR